MKLGWLLLLLWALYACQSLKHQNTAFAGRPYFCAEKTGEHCAKPVGDRVLLNKSANRMFLTWEISQNKVSQTLELKACAYRGSERQSTGKCQGENIDVGIVHRGESAFYTIPLEIPTDLTPGDYTLIATFSGSLSEYFAITYFSIQGE